MTVMIQVRNVPDELHRKLKARAAAAGMSLSDYALAELRKSAEQLTVAEFRARLAALGPGPTDLDIASIIRTERDSR